MANKVWKLNGRRGIAYVEGKQAAEQVMAACGEGKLPDAAMAEYRDKRGKPFAWQIPFDLARWDAVCKLTAVEREQMSI